MANSLLTSLMRGGLTYNEARVYLAVVELGSSTVQKISQRARVPRTTTYEVLDDLKEKGFVTEYMERKRALFIAEPPRALEDFAEKRVEEVRKQGELLKSLIPQVDARGQFTKGNRPVVRYFEGPRAIGTYLGDINTSEKGEYLGIFHYDRAKRILEESGYSLEKVRRKRMRSGSMKKIRSIYTASSGPIKGYSKGSRKAKYVPEKLLDLAADVAIRGDSVFLFSYKEPLRGVTIYDKDFAGAMRVIFNLLWSQLR